MNKYENAIDVVARYCSDVRSGVTPRMILTNELDILMELVEKATPKKAILVHDYDGYVYECPNCHMEFRPDYIMNHVKWNGCPYCLQRLLWGEDDE